MPSAMDPLHISSPQPIAEASTYQEDHRARNTKDDSLQENQTADVVGCESAKELADCHSYDTRECYCPMREALQEPRGL